MSVIAAALKHMLAANMPHDAILRAVEDMEAGLQKDEQAERRRESDRERKRAKRLRMSADSTDKTDALRGGDARVEVKTSNLDIEPEVKNKTRNDASGFQDALRAMLDEDRLDALIKHRRSRKAPVTAYAAELFISAAKACGISVAEATDHCIERNWLTVKPDWIAARPPARGSPGLRMDDFLGAVIEQQERQHAGPDQKIEGAPQALRSIPGGRWSG